MLHISLKITFFSFGSNFFLTNKLFDFSDPGPITSSVVSPTDKWLWRWCAPASRIWSLRDARASPAAIPPVSANNQSEQAAASASNTMPKDIILTQWLIKTACNCSCLLSVILISLSTSMSVSMTADLARTAQGFRFILKWWFCSRPPLKGN